MKEPKMTRRAEPPNASTATRSLPSKGTVANPIDRIRPDAPTLAPYGPYKVGVQTQNVTIPNSVDVLNTDDSTVPRYQRPLTLEVWFPATETTTPGGSYRASGTRRPQRPD